MIDKKIPMTAPKQEGITVHLEGLPDLVAMVADLQHQVDTLNAFSEDVFKAVMLPEHVHYFIEGKYEDTEYCEEAMDGLLKLLAKYRAMLSFLEKNGIDPEKVFGDAKTKGLS